MTGASRGLGEVIARVLAQRGYAVVVGARTPDRLQTVAGRPDLLALLSFAVSDNYLQIRQALGLTLRR